jgi:hypothetical protein
MIEELAFKKIKNWQIEHKLIIQGDAEIKQEHVILRNITSLQNGGSVAVSACC